MPKEKQNTTRSKIVSDKAREGLNTIVDTNVNEDFESERNVVSNDFTSGSKLYSEEAQEVLGKLPSSIVRWGMTLIFIIFFGIIIGCCFIKYPQVVTAPISLTTINPPSDLIAKTTGRIDTLFAKEGSQVNENDIIAIIYNTADFSDVCQVDSILTNIDSLYKSLNNDYKLGDLQNGLSELRGYCNDFEHYVSSRDIPRKRSLLQLQIAKYQQYYSKLGNQKELLQQDLALEHKKYARDSMLYAENVYAASEYEKAAQAYIQKRNSYAGFEASMTSTELTILQMEQQLAELDMQYNNDIAQYRRQIAESCSRLQAQTKQWRETYLLISPICGRLTLTKYWSENQNVVTGDKIATVVPTDSMQVVGIMIVPSTGFGKVSVGQTVNIRLNGYPYQEYGVLKGVISRLSSVPTGGEQSGYVAEVAFPNGMQSTYKTQLSLIQQMDGTGEIITKDQRLIERFIQPIRSVFDRAKGN